MQDFLMGNGILQVPGKQDVLKFKHRMRDFWPVC